MKKRIVILLSAVIFITGALGYRILHTEVPETFPITVLLRASHQDNALTALLRDGGYAATVDGAAATVDGMQISPSVLLENRNGTPVFFSSDLYSDVCFRLTMHAERRDGVCYADGVLLAPGKKVLLCTPIFYGYTEILTIKWG